MDFPTNLSQAEVNEYSLEVDENQESGFHETEQPGRIDYFQLIEAIQGFQYLYDLSHKNYKNNKLKSEAWQFISELLNCTVEDCKKAWSNLRDRFVKEKNKLSSGAVVPETSWQFYDAMQLIKLR